MHAKAAHPDHPQQDRAAPLSQEVALADVRKEISFCRKVGLRVLGIVENMSGFVCPGCHVRQPARTRARAGGRGAYPLTCRTRPHRPSDATGTRWQGESQIFPATSGGARALAEQSGCPFLGAVPLDPRIGMPKMQVPGMVCGDGPARSYQELLTAARLWGRRLVVAAHALVGKCCDEGRPFMDTFPASPTTAALKQIIERTPRVLASRTGPVGTVLMPVRGRSASGACRVHHRDPHGAAVASPRADRWPYIVCKISRFHGTVHVERRKERACEGVRGGSAVRRVLVRVRPAPVGVARASGQVACAALVQFCRASRTGQR